MTAHSLFFVDFAEEADRNAPACAGAGVRRTQANDFRPCDETELAKLQQHLSYLAAEGGQAQSADGEARD
jgi:hypothetical protein